MHRALLLPAAVYLCMLAGCANRPLGSSWVTRPAAPAASSFDWTTTAPAAHGVDPAPIAALVDQIQSGVYGNIRSMLLVKDGALIAEEYFPRSAERDPRQQVVLRSSPHQLFSATKSVTALLVGIAIDRGLISDVDVKINSFFPEYADLWAVDGRDRLTIRDLLTMQAGLAWDEWSTSYSDPRNDTVRMLLAEDPLRYLLSRPIAAPPGAKFTYNSGLSVLLGEVVHRASGLRLDQFAQRYLFEPLDITDFYWARMPGELVEASGGLFLRPRDMAKLGQLVLDDGRWRGQPIISAAWLRAIQAGAVNPAEIPGWVQADGYGLHWWLATFTVNGRPIRSVSARGRAGQFIVIFPEVHLVAVFTSLNDGPQMNQPLDMLRRAILSALAPGPVPAAGAAGP